MRTLVVNADDFGLARGVNDGIIEAHVTGIVTSASLMVLRPATAEAAALARIHPGLSVGLHFELGREADLDDEAETQRAFAQQLERFRELTGSEPTHVDSHHHVHARHGRIATFKRLVEPLGVPLRHAGQVAYIGGFWGQPDRGRVSRGALLDLIRAEAGEGFSELGCHPARITDDLRSTYLDERAIELRTLTEPGLREEIDGAGVELASFHAWPP